MLAEGSLMGLSSTTSLGNSTPLLVAVSGPAAVVRLRGNVCNCPRSGAPPNLAFEVARALHDRRGGYHGAANRGCGKRLRVIRTQIFAWSAVGCILTRRHRGRFVGGLGRRTKRVQRRRH